MAASCGDDDNTGGTFADARPSSDGAVTPDGGTAADADLGADAPLDSSGPLVTVVSPTAPQAGDYGADAIVTDASITVRCRVEPNPDTGAGVDSTSVRVTAITEGGSTEAIATPASVAHEYTAVVDLSSFANGPLSIRCSAADTDAPPRANSAQIGTFLDLGPRIEVFSPMSEGNYATQIDITFKVSAAPVASGDTGATPDWNGVQVLVSGTPVTISGDQSTGLFSGTVRFDAAIFNPSLEGPNSIIIRAPNTRANGPVTRTRSLFFNADSDGPTIAIGDPKPGVLVSGIVRFTATVSDSAGVDPNSVVATIAGIHQVKLASLGGGQFEGFFDSRVLSNMVFPTVVIRARDAVGNQSSIGYVIALDNQPPLVSLDPPAMREAKLVNNALVCSHLFDPVGEDAASDGDSLPQLSELRVRIEDRGNTASSTGVVIPKAGVADNTVQLWVLDDSSGALLVDTNGDGVCDDINPLIKPTSVPQGSNEAAVINLAPISPSGSANYALVDEGSFDDGLEAACTASAETDVPAAVCPATPMSRVTATELEKLPVVYTIPPVGGLQCVGNAFDSVATNISDGWACVAVRARDALGNVGVSPPLRLCFDADGDKAEGCNDWGVPWTGGPLPNCTGTYDAQTNTVDLGQPCTIAESYADFPHYQLRRTDL